jgi:hypothetical protein
MDRYWLLTNTCYGTWLPGKGSGFVGHVWEHRDGDAKADTRVVHMFPERLTTKEFPGWKRRHKGS